MQFKVGDRVRDYTGKIGDIQHYDTIEPRFLVDYGSYTNWRYTSDLTPISANDNNPRPCIVARIVEGQPLPSARPYVHPSREAAIKEAERLAGMNSGVHFAVFELVSRSIAAVQPVATEAA